VRPIFALFLSWLSLAASPLIQRTNGDQACLHSFAVGGRALQAVPCRDADPLGLAKNVDIAKVTRALNIRSELVRFRGCDDGLFSTAEEQVSGSSQATTRYVITYPSGSRTDFLAPITHELAHVLQIEMAGGLKPLQDSLESKRIELGADFLTGIVFSFALKEAGLGEFQHNLSLMGLYRDSSSNAHGSPTERTSAFRRGVFFDFANVGMNFPRASQYFQANIYGELVAVP
jgi:hypothetical protein